MSDLCVFTANASELLVASGKRVGIEVQSYSPTPWLDYVDGKLRCGIEFLQSRTEKYAMWVDGHDSLILKPEDVIMERFGTYSFWSDIIMAVERTCWPDSSLALFFDEGNYPQAGGFMGHTETMIESMQAALKCALNGDDQRAWTRAWLRHDLCCFDFDKDRRIFCSEGDGNTEGFDPCVRHWNGRMPGREEFWQKLQETDK